MNDKSTSKCIREARDTINETNGSITGLLHIYIDNKLTNEAALLLLDSYINSLKTMLTSIQGDIREMQEDAE